MWLEHQICKLFDNQKKFGWIGISHEYLKTNIGGLKFPTFFYSSSSEDRIRTEKVPDINFDAAAAQLGIVEFYKNSKSSSAGMELSVKSVVGWTNYFL